MCKSLLYGGAEGLCISTAAKFQRSHIRVHFCHNFDDSLPSKVVICDNFGNFGGFCVGHVELVAGNVVSLGSAALCGNELLASSCLENSGLTAE